MNLKLKIGLGFVVLGLIYMVLPEDRKEPFKGLVRYVTNPKVAMCIAKKKHTLNDPSSFIFTDGRLVDPKVEFAHPGSMFYLYRNEEPVIVVHFRAKNRVGGYVHDKFICSALSGAQGELHDSIMNITPHPLAGYL